jgi:hypothetical protein
MSRRAGAASAALRSRWPTSEMSAFHCVRPRPPTTSRVVSGRDLARHRSARAAFSAATGGTDPATV